MGVFPDIKQWDTHSYKLGSFSILGSGITFYKVFYKVGLSMQSVTASKVIALNFTKAIILKQHNNVKMLTTENTENKTSPGIYFNSLKSKIFPRLFLQTSF